MATTGQRPGDWKFTCALSGFVGWASDSVLLWNGLRVLRRFAGTETQRHPQEVPAATIGSERPPPWSQPEPPFTFRSPTAVTKNDL